MTPVNLKNKFALFNEYWTPKIIGEANDSYVKIFKAKGEFVCHSHENDDEFFLVVKGQLCIKLMDREVVLQEGDCFIVPKGKKHMPYAQEEAWVLIMEPKSVINTGDALSDKTVDNPEWI